MANLAILRSYAQKAKPETLPPSILFSHTEKTITIFDAYPKSMFHFLIMPRVGAASFAPLSVFNLTSLRSLLKCDKGKAKEVLLALKEEANNLRTLIEEEMIDRYGFKWDVWAGFHPVPSMEHLHLHVMSADLCSPAMKTKKHYNSFHPRHGFFQDIDEILSWFDADPSYFSTMSALKRPEYEPLLKDGLVCFRCDRGMKNMPVLKTHLQEEWDKLSERAKAKSNQKKRKREVEDTQGTDSREGNPPTKRREQSPGECESGPQKDT